MNRSLQIFAHGTTAVLSWHVYKFVAISQPAVALLRSEIFIEFELRWECVDGIGPCSDFT